MKIITDITRGIVQICSHCMIGCSGKYCDQCRTAQGRKEQDEANFEHSGFICEKCKPKKTAKAD